MTRAAAPRTLPVAVHPGADETFHSWLMRLSARLSVEPRTALTSVGYPLEPGSPVLPGYGIALPDRTAEAIHHTTRAPVDRIGATTLDAFDGGPLDLAGYDLAAPGGTRSLAAREWVHLGSSSACIACLAAGGYQWRLAWRFPWSAVCTEHGLLLENTCPRCGRPFNAGRRRDHGLGPASNAVPRIHVCANTVGKNQGAYAPRCDHPYTATPTTTCKQPDVMTAQNAVDLLLSPQHRSSHHDWWQDLRAVTAVLLTHGAPARIRAALPGLPERCTRAVADHYADRDRNDQERCATIARTGAHHSAPRRRTLLKVPTDPALMAAVLPLAVAALRDLHHLPPPLAAAPLPLPHGQALDLLTDSVGDRGRTLTTELRLRQASNALADASKKASGYNALTTAHRADTSLDTRHIPRLFPRNDYRAVRDLFTATGTTDDYARTYLSLCAAKLVTGGTWTQAAAALGADPRKATRNTNAVTTRLSTAGSLERVHAHVAHWVARMSAAPAADLVDYRALRAHHATRLTTTAEDAAQVLEGTGLNVTDNRRRCIATHRWHEHALEPLAEWPGWEDCDNVETAKEMYRRFVKELGAAPVPPRG